MNHIIYEEAHTTYTPFHYTSLLIHSRLNPVIHRSKILCTQMQITLIILDNPLKFYQPKDILF
jgi:hypothetical protein